MNSLSCLAAGSTHNPRPRQPAALRAVRCECQRCGVHAFRVPRPTVVAFCHNCGSTDMQPVETIGPPALAFAS